MAASTLVPLEQYLRTTYHPDREYVDGRITERNVGEYQHSLLQGLIVEYFGRLRDRIGPVLRAFPEVRLRVRSGNDWERRYRIPDICVLEAGRPRTPVIVEPPLITIEILSPDDTLAETARKCAEYVLIGVPNVWIVDPHQRSLYSVDSNGSHEIMDRRVRFTCRAQDIEVDFDLLFSQMDSD